MISRHRILKILLFVGITFLFVYQFIYSVNGNELNPDTSDPITNFIDDEITPYCDGLNYSLEGYDFSDVENLTVEIKESRKWYKNLIENYSKETNNVLDPKLKERFDSRVTVKFKSNFECHFNAKVRRSGDMIDHIEYGHYPKASLDIHLENGNILGITKFKLFLENTRGSDGGENEVLISSILRHVGYIAPRTAIIPVIVNNSPSSNYIFQEKAAKEMIEFHGFREGPILETNEKYLFEFQEFSKNVFDQDRKLFLAGKIINDKWLNKNLQNFKIGTEALQLYNKSIYSSYDPSNQLNYEFLNLDTLKLYLFDALNFSLNAKHGIINHNRKFFYDKISEKFVPIYYDGNSLFLSQPEVDIWSNYKKTKELSIAANYFLQNNQVNIDVLAKELNSFRLDYKIEELMVIFENLLNNMYEVSQFNELGYSQLSISENLSNAENHNVDFIFLENLKFQICTQKLTNCSDFRQGKDLASIIELTEEPDVLIFGNSLENALSKSERSKFISSRELYELDTDIMLHVFNGAVVSIDKLNNTLNIFINEAHQKVMITGDGILKNWNIHIDSAVKEQVALRQDSLLLTGCLTITNIEVRNIIITSKNQHCEDAINFLRTRGNIKSLNILNSINDGLDVDYSNLDIMNIEITKSGNDCLDLSGGQYTFNKIYLRECSDKAISVGENSHVMISDVNIKNSDIAIAIKDSSKVEIKDLYAQNIKTCIAIYRKKQEFGPSYGLIKNSICDKSSVNFIQSGSYYDG